ncbi:MAG: GlsB/YeaQ/YmgE family stress response membrane protein [Patescibacteria group bacterium]
MNILIWILFGALVGWIASMIMGTNAQQGVILNVVVGIVGAILGGWVMSFFGEGGVTGFNLYSLLVALLGSVLLIGIVRMVSK